MITWDSPKTLNSLSGEFWALSYEFCPYTYFSVTHGIMLRKQGGNCVRGSPSAKDAFEVLRFFK